MIHILSLIFGIALLGVLMPRVISILEEQENEQIERELEKVKAEIAEEEWALESLYQY